MTASFGAKKEPACPYPSKYYSLEGSDKVKHIYAGTLLVATIRTVGSTTAASYDHADHLSSTGVTTDDSGTIAELVDYYPYGSQRFDEKPAGTTEQRKFIGERFDTDTGLSYLNARYYNPTVGRFTGQDPVFWSLPQHYREDPQQWNSYSYAGNNPIVNSDPTGQAWDTLLDAALTAYDGSRFLEAAGSTIGNYVSLGIGALTGNDRLTNVARSNLIQSTAQLKERSTDLGLDIAGTALPFVPAAGLRTVQKADRLQGTLKVAEDASTFLSKGDKSVDVYIATKGSEQVYTGISNNLGRRTFQHGDRFTGYSKVTKDGPVTRNQARAIEQHLINSNPGFENKVNSISPSRPYYQKALDFARKWLQKRR